jgi:hypothetical protein
MPDSPVFEWVSAALERATTFDSLQARGTVRLALRKAGLDAASVDIEGMNAVLTRLMSRELATRKISNSDAICSQLVMDLKAANLSAPAGSDQSTPEAVFRRLFGGSDGNGKQGN